MKPDKDTFTLFFLCLTGLLILALFMALLTENMASGSWTNSIAIWGFGLAIFLLIPLAFIALAGILYVAWHDVSRRSFLIALEDNKNVRHLANITHGDKTVLLNLNNDTVSGIIVDKTPQTVRKISHGPNHNILEPVERNGAYLFGEFFENDGGG